MMFFTESSNSYVSSGSFEAHLVQNILNLDLPRWSNHRIDKFGTIVVPTNLQRRQYNGTKAKEENYFELQNNRRTQKTGLHWPDIRGCNMESSQSW